jgi:hypothetical protein
MPSSSNANDSAPKNELSRSRVLRRAFNAASPPARDRAATSKEAAGLFHSAPRRARRFRLCQVAQHRGEFRGGPRPSAPRGNFPVRELRCSQYSAGGAESARLRRVPHNVVPITRGARPRQGQKRRRASGSSGGRGSSRFCVSSASVALRLRIWLHMKAAPNPRPRRAGSARFDTYYKVQWYDARNCAWADVQKQYPNARGRRGRLPGRQALPHDGGNPGRPPAFIWVI